MMCSRNTTGDISKRSTAVLGIATAIPVGAAFSIAYLAMRELDAGRYLVRSRRAVWRRSLGQEAWIPRGGGAS